MTEPLALLRDHTVNGIPVSHEGRELVFADGVRLPQDTETTFKSQRGVPYTLGALYYLMQNQNKNFSTYFELCSKVGMPFVSMADRRTAVAYLSGRSDTYPRIEVELPETLVDIAPSRPDAESEALEQEVELDARVIEAREQLGERFAKRIRLTDDNDGDANDETSNETPIDDATFKPWIEADKAASERIVENELPLVTRVTSMRGKKTFGKVLEVLRELKQCEEARATLEKNFGSKVSSSSSSRSSSSSATANGRSSSQRTRSSSGGHGHGATPERPVPTGKPIIIVPSAPTGVITLFNAVSFFGNTKFVPTAEARKSVRKTNPMVFTRPNTEAKYEVYDSVASFRSSHWSRVVAVLLIGAEWQLRSLAKISTNPATLFNKVAGFYFKHDGDTVPEVVKTWNVTAIEVSKNQRYKDAPAAARFWNLLDAHCLRRSELQSLRLK